MKIAVIGAGYVGLVTGVCLAEIGHEIICIDNNPDKIKKLKSGKVPFFEPNLEPLIVYNVNEGRLRFSSNIGEGVEECEVVFLCVGTPPKEDGSANLEYVEQVIDDIAKHMKSYKVIVEKSTVPVQTNEWLEKLLKKHLKDKNVEFDIASNPEFLREGSAVWDFMNSDRIVIGVNSERAANLLMNVYRPLNAPLLVTDINSAEIIKHASNAFLATKISFINFVANVCEKTGADIEKVKMGIGMDKRIGMDFLNAGIGYGGSCFPKDVAAFISIAGKLKVDNSILSSVSKINKDQVLNFIEKIKSSVADLKGKEIALLGLSFKPNTDDIREAPSLIIIDALIKQGAKLRVYDPEAMDNVKALYPDLYYAKSAMEAISSSYAAVFITEWQEFKGIDFLTVRNNTNCRIIFDGRNLFNPERMEKLGFDYYSIGRRTGNKVLV